MCRLLCLESVRMGGVMHEDAVIEVRACWFFKLVLGCLIMLIIS
jgi:hypothetical protein